MKKPVVASHFTSLNPLLHVESVSRGFGAAHSRGTAQSVLFEAVGSAPRMNVLPPCFA